MRRFALVGCLLLLAGGCTSTVPERVRAYNADGIYLFQRGDYGHARETFAAALELAPEDTSIRYNLARACERAGDPGKAEKLYGECLDHDPNHADSRQALCTLLVSRGRRDDASHMVEGWLAKEPARADAYALDAWLWQQAGDLPRAQSRLQQALQLDPVNVRALNGLAGVYEGLHRPERALALYERSLEIQPAQPVVIDSVNRLRARGIQPPRPD